MATQLRTCKIERDGKAELINAFLASGITPTEIERKMKDEEGYPIKRETVKRHLDLCLLGRPGAGAPRLPAARGVNGNGLKATTHDIAILVQREVSKRLQDPNERMRVDVKDGLAAQALLDKRAEKEKDRTFVMNLARLISGAGQGAPEEIIDGDYVEVGDDEDGGLNPASLLAPPELRSGLGDD